MRVGLRAGSLEAISISSLLGANPGFTPVGLNMGWLEVLSEEPLGVTQDILQFDVAGFPTSFLTRRLTRWDRALSFRKAVLPWGGALSPGDLRGGLIGVGIALMNENDSEINVYFKLSGEGIEISRKQLKLGPKGRLVRFLSEIFSDIDAFGGFLPGDVEAARATVKIEAAEGLIRAVAVRVVREEFTVSDSAGGRRTAFIPLAASPLPVYVLENENTQAVGR